MKLQGKKALITGSRRGIGRAIALRLAEDGADIGINDIVRDETAEETLRMIRDLGSNVSWHEANVGRSADINRMVDEFIAEHGRIDILVNNAVGSIKNSFLDITEEDWDFEIGNALKGPFLANQRAAREMIAQGDGGRLVSIASVHAFWAKPYNLVYSIAKQGLIRMAMSMAVDLAGHNITCNAVAPGLIDSRVLPPDQEHQRAGPEYAPDVAAEIPLRVAGVPRDIAHAVAFLASDDARYVNGQCITVDGGMTIVGPGPGSHDPGISNISTEEIARTR
ncbi:MAG: SDR family oxidoreductase [Chloroflexi bacterium]|nr:SDR family oxidoreductase [Chloroflexota bacterium]